MFTMKSDFSKFFDRVIVETEVERIEFEGLKRNAMYIRKVARNSIRRRKSPSKPGQPPRSVRGDLKRGIEAHFERGVNESVVGPMGFGWSKGAQLVGAPNVLEFGGDTVIDRSVVRKVGDGGEVRVVSGAAAGVKRDSSGKFLRASQRGKEVRPGVRVVYGKIRTQAQAERATRINREIFAPQPVRVAARPFMAPALEKSLPKLAPMWAMSVRSS
jgi:hypothetical protein